MSSPRNLGHDPAALEQWVSMLDLAGPSPDEVGGSIVRLGQPPDAPDQVEVALLPLRGDHPTLVLDGYVAPPDTLAIGVITGGWVGPMGEGAPSQHPFRQRVTSTVLVGRVGNVAARVRTEDGPLLDTSPTEGAVLDALKASLGGLTR
jgi:hypothetical protein